MLLRTLPVGALRTNCYLLGCPDTHRAILIDPGAEPHTILAAVRDLGLTVERIVLTHSHYDHVLAAPALREETGALVAIHAAEAEALASPPGLLGHFVAQPPPAIRADQLLSDGDLLEIGNLTAQVLHTPGHSPGGVSVWVASAGAVFCGDALFRGGIGRTDLAGSNHDLLLRSIRERIFALPPQTIAYPGHGPRTVIAEEKASNPWLQP